jgi:hypothetical protein
MIVKLIAEPLQFNIKDLASFIIGVEAYNETPGIITPGLDRSSLFINGALSHSWELAVGNGRREPKWFNLPPGEKIAMTWPTLGQSLFKNPGSFQLQLKLGTHLLDSILVEVTGNGEK